MNLTWAEKVAGLETGAVRTSGFGSRLIDATLKGELSGTLARDYGPDGVTIQLSVPLDPTLNSET
jgi:two-component sensor histidine kinase